MVSYAQYQEDLILARFFGDQAAGFFVEAGALDGVYLSNTKLLEERGWHGLLVEPDRRYAAACQANRPHSTYYNLALVAEADDRGPQLFYETSAEALSTLNPARACAMLYEGIKLTVYPVAVTTLHQLLSRYHPPAIDLMSLDTETTSHETLKGARIDIWRPRIILIEIFTAEERASITAQMQAAGYTLAWSRENYFYVRDPEDAPILAAAAREVLRVQ